MAKFQVNEAVLLRTSAATDVQSSGGYISIAGLSSTWKKLLSSIKQIKYKAEVVQVVTVGGVDTSWVPVGGTTYGVLIGDPRRNNAGSESILKPYTYTTSASLAKEGTTAALRREYINSKIVTAINNDPSNYGIAVSLGSGNGLTFTDDAGYNPLLLNDANLLYAQGQSSRQGKSTVQIWQDVSGNGYASTNIAITTAAVYAFGVGADLSNGKPVMDFMYGNLISGTLIAPPLTTAGLGAISGQKYDAFVIQSFGTAAAHNQTGQDALIPKVKTIWVDNGTGSDTANLAGFVAFEREILRALFDVYKSDASALYGFFDSALVASATYPTTGVAITTTDNVVMAVQGSQGDNWYVNPIGTHTVLTPIVGTGGMNIILDATDEEGMEISAPNLTQCPKEFVVGKSEYSFYARISATNYAHLEEFAFGLRKKAAYAVNLVAYDVASDDFAALAVTSEAVNGLMKIQTSKAAAGIVTTSTAQTWSSGAHDLLITVDLSGNVRFYLDSVDYTSLQATAYTFVAGTHVIPFIDTTLDANVDAAPLLLQAAALPTISWRS